MKGRVTKEEGRKREERKKRKCNGNIRRNRIRENESERDGARR